EIFKVHAKSKNLAPGVALTLTAVARMIVSMILIMITIIWDMVGIIIRIFLLIAFAGVVVAAIAVALFEAVD
ncbi:unnamed protein product, partial [Effrenium voratum]